MLFRSSESGFIASDMKDKIKQLEEQVSFLVGLLDERQLEDFTCFLHNQENKNGEENNNKEE